MESRWQNDCENPNDPGNSPRYHTGEPCIEAGCNLPAGTVWSPLWCQFHNAERLMRIEGQLRRIQSFCARAEGGNYKEEVNYERCA